MTKMEETIYLMYGNLSDNLLDLRNRMDEIKNGRKSLSLELYNIKDSGEFSSNIEKIRENIKELEGKMILLKEENKISFIQLDKYFDYIAGEVIKAIDAIYQESISGIQVVPSGISETDEDVIYDIRDTENYIDIASVSMNYLFTDVLNSFHEDMRDQQDEVKEIRDRYFEELYKIDNLLRISRELLDSDDVGNDIIERIIQNLEEITTSLDKVISIIDILRESSRKTNDNIGTYIKVLDKAHNQVYKI